MADISTIRLSPHEIELLDKINELVQSKKEITEEIYNINQELANMGSPIVISDTEPENPVEGLIWIDTSSGIDIDTTYLKTAGGVMTGTLTAGYGINLSRANNSVTGIKYISKSNPAQLYIADASATGSDGMSGNLTAPIGVDVTTMAVRQVMTPSEGNGWTWESLEEGSTTPTILAELSSVNGNFRTSGTITANKVVNIGSNDYAEFFPRFEDTEVGDIIALAVEADNEAYKKATINDNCIVGVHTECFGHILGGEEPPGFENYFKYNMTKYIPVALAGRCPVKIIGAVIKGAPVVPSDIPGVGRVYDAFIDDHLKIIGYLVESDDKEDEVRLLKIKVK